MPVTSRSSCNELQLQWIGHVSASPWMIVVPVLWRKPSSDFMTKDLSTETWRFFVCRKILSCCAVAFSDIYIYIHIYIEIHRDTFLYTLYMYTSKYMILCLICIYIYIYIS